MDTKRCYFNNTSSVYVYFMILTWGSFVLDELLFLLSLVYLSFNKKLLVWNSKSTTFIQFQLLRFKGRMQGSH